MTSGQLLAFQTLSLKIYILFITVINGIVLSMYGRPKGKCLNRERNNPLNYSSLFSFLFLIRTANMRSTLLTDA